MNGIYDGGIGGHIVGIEQITFDSGAAIDFTNGYTVNANDAANTIYGGHLADVLDANGGDDYIYGQGGADTLIGGTGRDYLYGGTGDDTYRFEAGFGSVSGADDITEYLNEGTDRILLAGGITQSDIRWWTENQGILRIERTADTNDSIRVNGIYDGSIGSSVVGIEQIIFDAGAALDFTNGYTVNANDAANTIYGGHLADVLDANGGDDYIYGQGGADTLIGGAGRDYLYGGAGDDTYRFEVGFGSASGPDDITEYLNEGTDKIWLAGGIDQSGIRWWTENQGILRIERTADTTDSIKVNGIYDAGVGGSVVGIEQIIFDADTAIDFTNGYTVNDSDAGHTIYGGHLADVLDANGGDDYIYGQGGADTLIGGAGRDYLYGGAGDDTYRFEVGFGSASGPDDITEYLNEGTDKIWLAGGITQSDIRWWTENQGVLRIERTADTTDSIRVAGIYDSGVGGSVVGIEQIIFDADTTLDFTNGYTVNANDSANTIYGGHLADVLDANGGNDYIYAGTGDDVLDGGAGNDYLYGEAGNDTYLFAEGLDIVTEASGTDVLWITGGSTINDITVSNHSSNDTKVVINASTDEVRLVSFRSSSVNEIETIRFDDGFEADLPSYNSWLYGNTGDDLFVGNASGHVMIALSGNDDVDAGGGDDHVHGGTGDDTINGEDGADFLHGGAGNDTVDGDAGDDVLYGGDGLDTLWGDAGADSFVFMSASAFNNVDVIKDFTTADNDVLDIVDLLTGYDPLTDAITDFVEITDNGTDSTLKVDTDGGADNFVTVATLEGATGLTDEAALETNGHLLAA